MTMAQLVLSLEIADKFHLLERPRLLENMHPMVYGFAVLFFNRWEIGSRAFYRFLGCHGDHSSCLHVCFNQSCTALCVTCDWSKDLHFVFQPRHAASSAAMSIFFICIIASNARLATAGSGSVIAFVRAIGVICQNTPHLSLHQPHALS